MNGVKKINNTDIYGPTLNIRGITSSQIKTQHTFIYYLFNLPIKPRFEEFRRRKRNKNSCNMSS